MQSVIIPSQSSFPVDFHTLLVWFMKLPMTIRWNPWLWINRLMREVQTPPVLVSIVSARFSDTGDSEIVALVGATSCNCVRRLYVSVTATIGASGIGTIGEVFAIITALSARTFDRYCSPDCDRNCWNVFTTCLSRLAATLASINTSSSRNSNAEAEVEEHLCFLVAAGLDSQQCLWRWDSIFTIRAPLTILLAWII